MIGSTRFASALSGLAVIGALSTGLGTAAHASPALAGAMGELAQSVAMQFTVPSRTITLLSRPAGISLDVAESGSRHDEAAGLDGAASFAGGVGETRLGGLGQTIAGPLLPPWAAVAVLAGSLPVLPVAEVSLNAEDYTNSSLLELMLTVSGGVDAMIQSAQWAKSMIPDLSAFGDEHAAQREGFGSRLGLTTIVLNVIIQVLFFSFLIQRRRAARRHPMAAA